MPLKTQDFAATLKAKRKFYTHTHTQTEQSEGEKEGLKKSHRVRNFNFSLFFSFFWQTILGRFNQFQLKNLIVSAMNAPTEERCSRRSSIASQPRLASPRCDKADNCLSSLSSGKSRVELRRRSSNRSRNRSRSRRFLGTSRNDDDSLRDCALSQCARTRVGVLRNAL